MKHPLLLLGAALLSFSVDAQLWTRLQTTETAAKTLQPEARYALDEAAMAALIAQASSAPQPLILPLPNGEQRTFLLSYDPVYSDSFAKHHPELLTFKGVDQHNPRLTGRFDLTPNGFHAMFRQDGKLIYIDPDRTTESQYLVYQHRRGSGFIDAIRQVDTPPLPAQKPTAARGAINLRTYRIIVAATGEYTRFHGGESAARAEIVTAINRVNQVFETDLAVRLQLVNPAVDSPIYSDPATDPFVNDVNDDIETMRSLLNSRYGAGSYDLGHLFSTSSGGGLAYVSSVCSDSFKGGGVTGAPRPTGDSFYIDFVSHELGHQFGANHTYNSSDPFCDDQRNNPTAFEPGSGSSIMAYSGLCNSDNLQTNADAYFHAGSIAQVRDYINSGGGSRCGTSSVLSNNDPVVDAGADYTVPAQTPLRLSGSATNSETTDSLSYSWEQLDAGSGAVLSLGDIGSGPLFRSWPPQSTPIRYLPRLQDVIDGSLTLGEAYATTDRVMNFRLTVRDGSGGVESDDIQIRVENNAGPFSVIAPASNSQQSATAVVEWNVAGTATAPISCTQVDILLSTDNGSSFEQTLLSATPNDGSQSVNLPNSAISDARIMVQCSDNIFLAVSERFQIRLSAQGNQAPQANPDSYTLAVNSGETLLNVLANDSDADNDNLSITSSSYSGSGRLTISNNQLSYTPASDFVGEETASYTISDGRGGTDSATVRLTVTNSNRTPIANDDSYSIRENSAQVTLSPLDNDLDPDGHAISLSSFNYSGSSQLEQQGNQLIYQPASGLTGSERFSYSISDGQGGVASAVITLNISANRIPLAANDSYSVQAGASVSLDVLANDTDADNDTLRIIQISYAGTGSAVLSGNQIRYTAPTNQSGADAPIRYRVSDGFGGEAEAVVTVNIQSGEQSESGSGGGGGSLGGFSLLLLLGGLIRRRLP